MLTAPTSTTAKGNHLEEAFVLWMEEHRYHSIVHVQGRPLSYIGGDYKPDILASRFSYLWTFLSVISAGYVIFWLSLAFINYQYLHTRPGLFLSTNIPALVILFISLINCKIHCWVECKNWEKPIVRTVVQNLYVSMIVAKEKKGGIWEGILVSKFGFRREVLELAAHLKIQCYQWKDNEFKKVWFVEPQPDPLKPYA